MPKQIVQTSRHCPQHRTRILYVENKSGGLNGTGRIGRVTFSKSGRSLSYSGRTFQPVKGYKFNHIDIQTGEHYWISGPKKRGGDRLYGGGGVEIDADVREEYWTHIRGRPEDAAKRTTDD